MNLIHSNIYILTRDINFWTKKSIKIQSTSSFPEGDCLSTLHESKTLTVLISFFFLDSMTWWSWPINDTILPTYLDVTLNMPMESKNPILDLRILQNCRVKLKYFFNYLHGIRRSIFNTSSLTRIWIWKGWEK